MADCWNNDGFNCGYGNGLRNSIGVGEILLGLRLVVLVDTGWNADKRRELVVDGSKVCIWFAI